MPHGARARRGRAEELSSFLRTQGVGGERGPARRRVAGPAVTRVRRAAAAEEVIYLLHLLHALHGGPRLLTNRLEIPRRDVVPALELLHGFLVSIVMWVMYSGEEREHKFHLI